MEKHTQGKWNIDRDGYPEGDILEVSHHSSDGWSRRVVAIIFEGHNHPTLTLPSDEDEANAELIASAPDMLKILVEIGKILLEHEEHLPYKDVMKISELIPNHVWEAIE